MKETLKVFTFNHPHVRQGNLAKRRADQSRKSLGSALVMDILARIIIYPYARESLRDGMSMLRVMRGEVRVKDSDTATEIYHW